MAEKDDWLDDFDSPDDKASDSDQSDLDTLLSGTSASPPVPGGEEEAELDQSAIDALMSGAGEGTPPASMDETSGLDQSDIDSLLASPKNPAKDQAGIDPDQDEIDRLFSDVDSGGTAEESSFPAEEIDFKDVFDSTDSAPQNANLGFDAEEFKLDVDIPDIPDAKPAPDLGAPKIQTDSAAIAFAADQTTKFAPEPTSFAASDEQDIATKGAVFLHNRKLLIGLGAGLAVLLSIAGFLFMKDRSHTPTQTPAEVAAPPAPTVKPPEPAPLPPQEPKEPQNGAPTLADLDLTMPPESRQLEIVLCGIDPENDPLQYVMSLPEHGQLSGQPPNLVYTPNPELNGQDGFIVRVSDGKNISTPAKITITRKLPETAKETAAPVGAAPKPEAPAEVAKNGACPPTKEGQIEPKPESIQAKDKSFFLSGSKGLVIDWEKIWCDANSAPYKPDVQIDILAAPRHGSLDKINNSKSHYLPSHGFRGTDTIKYRFKQGELTSEGKTVVVSVARKDRAPVIHLQPIAPIYMTGDTVVLNASQTSDDQRKALTFCWTQLAGAPIVIKPLNSNGSQIAFVVPSSFSTVTNPTLLINVTATNQQGEHDSKDIKITTKSRRQSAIWDGF